MSTEAKYGIIAAFVFATYDFAAFNLTLAGDYWYIFHQSQPMQGFFIQINRWGAVVLWKVFYGDSIVAPLSISILIVSLIVVAMRLCKLLDITDPIQQIVFCCLFLSCPILIEHIQFKINHILLAFCLLTCITSIQYLLKAKPTIIEYLMSVSLLTLAFGTLQVTSVFFATSVTFIALDRFRATGNYAPHIQKIFPMAGVALIALVFSLLIGALLKTIFEIPDLEDTNIHSLHLVQDMASEIDSVAMFIIYVVNFYIGDQVGWSTFTKLVFLVVFVLFLRKNLSGAQQFTKILVTLGLLVLFLLLPFALGLVRTSWSSYRYTAMFPLMLIYPLIIGVVLRDCRDHNVTKAVLVLTGIILLQFSQSHNKAAIATYANNERDRFEAARIYQEVMKLDGPSVEKMLVVGVITDDFSAPFNLPEKSSEVPFGQSFLINQCSALNCQPRHLASLFRSISYFPTDMEVIQISSAEFRENGPKDIDPIRVWPEQGSIVKDGDQLYLFLEDPTP